MAVRARLEPDKVSWKKTIRSLGVLAPREAQKATKARIFEAAKAVQKGIQSIMPKTRGSRVLHGSIAIRRKTKGTFSYAVVGPKRRVEKFPTVSKGSIHFTGKPNPWRAIVKRVPTKYAHLVERGAAPHLIRITRGPFAGVTIHHPGFVGRRPVQIGRIATTSQVNAILAKIPKDVENALRQQN